MSTTDIAAKPGPAEGPERNLDGRFLAGRDYHAELDAIAEIARHAARDDEDPTEIGRVRFDRARDALGLAVPSAQALAKRMRRPLAKIIEMALAEDAKRNFAGGHDHANETQRDFPETLMVAALKAASREIAGQAPSRLRYDAMVARDNARRQARRLPTQRLPHSETIAARFGSWDHALLAAGLIESLGDRGGRSAKPKAPAAAQTLDGFITKHSFLPSSGYFSNWCKASGIPLGRDLKPWDDVIENCRALRGARGEDIPETATPTREAPAIEDIAEVGESTRGRKVVTLEDCEASVRAWAKSGISGPPTFRKYKAWATETDGAVSSSSLLRAAGSFSDLCRRLGVG